MEDVSAEAGFEPENLHRVSKLTTRNSSRVSVLESEPEFFDVHGRPKMWNAEALSVLRAMYHHSGELTSDRNGRQAGVKKRSHNIFAFRFAKGTRHEWVS